MDPARHRGQPALSTGPARERTDRQRVGAGVRWALVLVLLAQLLVALFPFRLDPPRTVDNDVTRTADGGLRFGVHNRAETTRAPSWLDDARAGSTVRVDLLVRAARDDPVGPARILTVSDGFYRGDLTIGQQRGDLVVRVRRPGADQAGWPDLFAPGALRRPTWVAVSVVVAPEQIIVRVDDRAVVDVALPSPPANRWNRGFRLALGNEVGGGRPWEGGLQRAEVRVDGRTYDYLEPGAVDVPRRFWYDPHRDWEPLLPSSPADVLVGFVHLLLYLPLGALLVAGRPAMRVAFASLAVIALSLALTAAKMLFAMRHPSFADVAWQSLGGILGVLLFRRSHGR